MDQYFNQMEKIVKERKTSSRIRFMLQDVIDLRLVSSSLLLRAPQSSSLPPPPTSFCFRSNLLSVDDEELM